MKTIRIFAIGALMMGSLSLRAQEWSVNYTTEVQTAGGSAKLVGLLRLDAVVDICEALSIETAAFGIAKTGEERLMGDLQAFSNIEADNLPLALAVCGARWNMGKQHSMFAGVRNVNEDYFNTSTASFFTNSSCGMVPTIGLNYPIANYPMASLGLHYLYESTPIGVQASLYNGIGHNGFVGRESVFRFRPYYDGLFAMAQIEYRLRSSIYFLGTSMRSDEGNLSTTLWCYAEQAISHSLTVIASWSYAFDAQCACRYFFGCGAKYAARGIDMGVFTDHTLVAGIDEWATELTCMIHCNGHISIQPALHIVTTGPRTGCVGMIRMHISI